MLHIYLDIEQWGRMVLVPLRGISSFVMEVILLVRASTKNGNTRTSYVAQYSEMCDYPIFSFYWNNLSFTKINILTTPNQLAR